MTNGNVVNVIWPPEWPHGILGTIIKTTGLREPRRTGAVPQAGKSEEAKVPGMCHGPQSKAGVLRGPGLPPHAPVSSGLLQCFHYKPKRDGCLMWSKGMGFPRYGEGGCGWPGGACDSRPVVCWKHRVSVCVHLEGSTETGSFYVAQAGLKFIILFSQPPECWDYRQVPSPWPEWVYLLKTSSTLTATC